MDINSVQGIYLSIYLSVCLSVCLSIYLSIHLSIYVSIYLSILCYHFKFKAITFSVQETEVFKGWREYLTTTAITVIFVYQTWP